MPAFYQLEFEKPVVALEKRIAALKEQLARFSPSSPSNGASASSPSAGASVELGMNPSLEAEDAAASGEDAENVPPADPAAIEREIAALDEERHHKLRDVYTRLSPWDTVRVARHPKRPQTRDYIEMIFKDFTELHGDRRFGDDPAMVVGFARLGSTKCLVVGHQKGRTTQEKIACHFGCAHPEGYRKALAKMLLAEKFGVPIVTFVDTPGAYPGIGAEARGQAEAIAVNLREMSRIKTPIVSVVIGEGGSGGALGIAVADRVAMLQNSWYSVISPEGCAAILWKTANEQTNNAAAIALKLTAPNNLDLGIIDAIIPEPVGGAHRDPKGAAANIERWLTEQIHGLKSQSPATLPQTRYERFRKLGSFEEAAAT
jgi:acetyl-CoA carboxylase carboxyl transferase subunit alpha